MQRCNALTLKRLYMSHKLVIKDAARQLIWRVISWLCGFLVIKFVSPYLWPLRYWDYGTILKFFAIWSAMADFWLYVIAVKRLWIIKKEEEWKENKIKMKDIYGKFVGTRFIIMSIVYFVAIIVAYFLPAYTSNPYIVRGLPLGMVFSASFMAAWILQLPLQLFWRMKDLSVGLILARISQIIILIVTLFVLLPSVDFTSWDPKSITAFLLILISVVASGVTQLLYVVHKSNQKLKLKIQFDKKFTKDIVKWNWKYWLSYYLSSFHTLIVLIFLSNFFPTSQWFVYTWIWALWLTLIEVFLIIPSALWNSLLHNVASYTHEAKRKSFGNLMTLVTRIWWIVLLNFFLFKNEIIYIISWSDFIWNSLANPWTNIILPYLWLVLFLSFIKQIFNYIFVANEKQNKLLNINLFGVTIGLAAGLYLIPKFQIVGWIATQVLLEILFVIWAIYIWYRQKVLPKINRKKTTTLIAVILIIWTLWYLYINIDYTNFRQFILAASAINIPILLFSLPSIKKIARWLTQ